MTGARVSSPGTAGTSSGAGAEGQAPSGRGLRIVLLALAFACGASVANLYYAQPLLGLIRHSFGISSGTAALAVTLTQVGYALGLALLLPLGDLLEDRKLASRTLVVTAPARGGPGGSAASAGENPRLKRSGCRILRVQARA
jgi:hypothetical protein